MNVGRRTTQLLLAIALAVSVAASAAFGQEPDIDFNEYYRFPLSFGAEYQNISPLTKVDREISNAFELSLIGCYPLPFVPVVQPMARVGIMQFDIRDATNPERWDHMHVFGAIGAGYVNRFSKQIELGAEISVGFSQGIFEHLDEAGGQTWYSPNVMVNLGARVSLSPSYNMNINLHPDLRLLLSTSSMKSFDGLYLGLGVSLSYRLGEDPDSSQSIIRSIRFGETTIEPVFAALQSYYAQNSFGTIEILNTEKFSIYDVEVSFFQKGFMDNPTTIATVSELAPGEKRALEIVATYNKNVFDIEGGTPLTGEVRAFYKAKTKTVTQSESVDYYLYDKTSLVWDDDRKVCAYITPKDSALRNYASSIRQYTKNDVIAGLSQNLQTGMQMYAGLTELGCLYQVDPTSAFDDAQGNPQVVDSVSLPRTTLKRATGDCDDLTVLYNSLMEIAGIETGFITTPGHIYSVFNTGVPVREYRTVHPDSGMIINVGGLIWVPVEITMLGSDDFMAAWRRGAEEWNMYEDDSSKRGFYLTRECTKIYPAVGLTETDLGIQYGDRRNIAELFNDDKDTLVSVILDAYRIAAEESKNKRDYNQLGIVAAQLGEYERAEAAFKTSLSLDKNWLSAQVNLGNVYLLRERYTDAVQMFHSVVEALKERGRDHSGTALRAMINIAKAYYELENFDRAAEYYDQVAAADPDFVEEYRYLGNAGTGEGRSSKQENGTPLFDGD